jgi:hypothetical protein
MLRKRIAVLLACVFVAGATTGAASAGLAATSHAALICALNGFSDGFD